MTGSSRRLAPARPHTNAASRVAFALAAVALVAIASLVIYQAGRPVDTADFWLNLATGATYASEGPWPARDPLLHTANSDAPVQHQWLFAVLLHGIERAFGFPGLRAFHALCVAGTIWLGFSLFRRASGMFSVASWATGLFLLFASWRLLQFRADLISIPADLLLYRLLLEDAERPPSWKRVGASALLFWLWANMHSLFVVGLLHLCAALLGLGLREVAGRRGGLRVNGPDPAWSYFRRIGAALAIGVIATGCNPRGFNQHVTFLTSSGENSIWSIPDDWSHFVPWDPNRYGQWLSLPGWLAIDGILILLAVASLVVVVRWVRQPSLENFRATEPVLLALAWSSVVALCVAVRFVWMAVFPLLFLLRSGRAWMEKRSAWQYVVQGAFAFASVLNCVAYERVGGFRAFGVPGIAEYFDRHYSVRGCPEASVLFLQETGLEGNLYNGYQEGGFIGYWLAPRLRTFIDGRTEHYSKDVYEEYCAIDSQGLTRPQESILDILERRGVDVFMGQGLPLGPRNLGDPRYTTVHLEGVPGWLLVYRTLDESIYLRASPRNSENLARVARYYESEGVPFDRARGLDVGAVVQHRPDWAVAHWMLVHDHDRLLAARSDTDPDVRYFVLELMSTNYALIGNYREQVALDRECSTLRPREKGPRRRLVYGLLHLARFDEAVQASAALLELDPRDPRSIVFDQIARYLSDTRNERGPTAGDQARAMLMQLPLLDREEVQRTIAGRIRPWLPLLPPGRPALASKAPSPTTGG